MGYDAHLLAIGPYSEDLAEHLDWHSDYYRYTPHGAPVLSRLFLCESTSSADELADAFGLRDAFDFSKGLEVKELWRPELLPDHICQEEVTRFHRLKAAGFRFYFVVH